MNKQRFHLHACALASALALGGCGGGGSEPAPPMTASADIYTLDWNAARRLSVQDNDGGATGATLTVLEAPKHGNAVIDGSVVVYTPTTGYFGEDALRYRLTRAGASVDAEVKLTVEAALTLEGQAGDTPLPGARITAMVGGKTSSVDADAEGRYALSFKASKAGDFVSLSATGAGAQSRVVYESLVGEVGRMASRAVAGKLAIAQWPALRLNPLSSATVGLLAQRGALPTNDTQLGEGLSRLATFDLVYATALAQLTVDQNLPLPTGAATTAELLRSATLYAPFQRQQLTDKRHEIEAIRLAMESNPRLLAAPPKPDGAPLTALYVNGVGAGPTSAYRVTLAPDGKAAVVSGVSARSGRWQHDGQTLSIVYDTPSLATFEDYDDNGNSWTVTRHTTGLEFRELAVAGTHAGAALVRWTGFDVDGADGRRPGVERHDVERLWDATSRQPLPGAGTTLQASEFAVGNRWAGIYAGSSIDATGYLAMPQDVLAITGANTGKLERTGINVTWTLTDGVLEVVLPEVTHRYQRRITDGSGAERWLVEQRKGGQPEALSEALVIAADAQGYAALLPQKVWQTNAAIGFSHWRRQYGFRQDKHASLGSLEYDLERGFYEVASYNYYGWRQIGSDKVVIEYYSNPSEACFQAPVCESRISRELRVVARRGTTLYAIESFFGGSHRLVAMTDIGPAR